MHEKWFYYDWLINVLQDNTAIQQSVWISQRLEASDDYIKSIKDEFEQCSDSCFW
jgi:hypothetical protein